MGSGETIMSSSNQITGEKKELASKFCFFFDFETVDELLSQVYTYLIGRFRGHSFNSRIFA